MSERIWHLKHCSLFEQLANDELAELERHCRMRKFPKHSPIYLPADASNGVLLLAAGRVKISNVTAEGKQAILSFIEPGELFGELALFDSQRRDEYADAVDASTVILIPADEMLRLMERHAEVSLGISKLIGLRRRRIERRLKNLLFHSNRERLVHLLLELADGYGRQDGQGVLIGIKLSHQDLASIIGSTRETVTVLLGELQAQGHVRMGRQKIVLVDRPRLAATLDAAYAGRNTDEANEPDRVSKPAARLPETGRM